jgi:hypothetical protein
MKTHELYDIDVTFIHIQVCVAIVGVHITYVQGQACWKSKRKARVEWTPHTMIIGVCGRQIQSKLANSHNAHH